MLAIRVTTALVLIPLVLLGLFKFPTLWFALMMGVACLLGAFEWSSLHGDHRTALSLLLIVLGIVLYWDRRLVPWVILAGVLWWLWCAIELRRDHRGFNNTWLNIVHGVLTLLPAWCALVFLHSKGAEGRAAIFSMLLVVWTADTFAYFTGKQWGKRRLAPAISPGKSVEGAVGGFVGVLVFALISGLAYWQLDAMKLSFWLILCIVTGVAAVLGDLTESKLKRAAGVKDSGTLLPGHGGILDRIDSLVAAAPVFSIGIIVLGLTGTRSIIG